MTDLDININLARAMGWKLANKALPNEDSEYGIAMVGNFPIVLCWDAKSQTSKPFDYRDPVVFVAICKHWKLVVNFDGWVSGVFKTEVIGHWSKACIEQAAALTVIELAKRGVK